MMISPSRVSRICVLIVVMTSVSALTACADEYRVEVANGAVILDKTYWRPVTNSEPFAENFEAQEQRPNEKHPQVLTVFKAPIQSIQKGDIEVAPGVWVEFMVVHPPSVTLQVSVAQARYWVLSRQTFDSSEPRTYGPVRGDSAQKLMAEYLDEVSRTRSILESLVAR